MTTEQTDRLASAMAEMMLPLHRDYGAEWMNRFFERDLREALAAEARKVIVAHAERERGAESE